MQGKCLCGRVEFELIGSIPRLYQCHCSLCRKVSGSSANAALVIDAAQFRWLGGEEEISQYESETAFKSHFCRHCGSPVPNATRNNSAYWVPVGLLQDDEALKLAAHVYMDSRAQWDELAGGAECFAEMPDAATSECLFRPDGE